MDDHIKSEKDKKRKEYKLIRCSDTPTIHEKIKSNVYNSLKILLKKYHKKDKYIGIYWPLKDEVDIRFLKNSKNYKIALPSSSKEKGINYHPWSKKTLNRDSNNIPAPLKEISIDPINISILLVPALAIDQDGYRLGYGGGYFDRLREQTNWFAIPSFVVISHKCISKNPLPRNEWDLPFNGWISEKGLHQVQEPQ